MFYIENLVKRLYSQRWKADQGVFLKIILFCHDKNLINVWDVDVFTFLFRSSLAFEKFPQIKNGGFLYQKKKDWEFGSGFSLAITEEIGYFIQTAEVYWLLNRCELVEGGAQLATDEYCGSPWRQERF